MTQANKRTLHSCFIPSIAPRRPTYAMSGQGVASSLSVVFAEVCFRCWSATISTSHRHGHNCAGQGQQHCRMLQSHGLLSLAKATFWPWSLGCPALPPAALEISWHGGQRIRTDGAPQNYRAQPGISARHPGPRLGLVTDYVDSDPARAAAMNE